MTVKDISSVTHRYSFSIDRKIKPEERVFLLKAKVWVYSGPASWYLLTLPKNAGKTIKKRFGYREKGWGSLPVEVEAGAAKWKTSIFSDKKSGSYVLPLKADARKKAGIKRGDLLTFTLTIL